MKKCRSAACFLLAFAMVVIVFLLTSCDINDENHQYLSSLRKTHGDLFGKVEMLSRDDETGYHIEYEGNRYDEERLNLFDRKAKARYEAKEDVLISWESLSKYVPVWYLDEYYSYTTDNPIYIHMPRLHSVFLRSDYNYESDIFILEGTERGFVFSETFFASDFAYDHVLRALYSHSQDITLYSAQYPQLQMSLSIFCEDGVWYAGGGHNEAIFEMSDAFVQHLADNGII